MPYFKDCVGALNGLYFLVYVPANKVTAYYNRKGIPLMNVFTACDFSAEFLFIIVG